MKIEEILIREGKYVGAMVGVSMLPMLKSGRDLVVILPAKSRLKPFDVALYKRDGKYWLHRVITIANGCMCCAATTAMRKNRWRKFSPC